MKLLNKRDVVAKFHDLLQHKILGSNAGAAFLKMLSQPDYQNKILAFCSVALGKRDESKVRQLLADFYAGEIVNIADTDEGITSGRDGFAQAKLRIETRKWLIEKLAPQIYGGKGTHQDAKSLTPKLKTRVYLPKNGRT